MRLFFGTAVDDEQAENSWMLLTFVDFVPRIQSDSHSEIEMEDATPNPPPPPTIVYEVI